MFLIINIFHSGKKKSWYKNPVHVVLVSLLVDQLSSLFLTFFGWPKKNLFSLREFLVSLWIFFGQALIFWYTKKKFWYTKKKLGGPKKSEPDQKFPETDQIFFWSTKKGRNRPYNWLTKRLTKTTWTGLIQSFIWQMGMRWLLMENRKVEIRSGSIFLSYVLFHLPQFGFIHYRINIIYHFPFFRHSDQHQHSEQEVGWCLLNYKANRGPLAI